MPPQFNQPNFSFDSTFQGSTPEQSKKRGPNVIVLAVIGIVALAVILTAWTLISAARQNHAKGTLDIQISDQSASIKIIPNSGPALDAGKGSTKARVNPGDYTVIASSSNKRSLATASVGSGEVANITLDLKDGTSLETVANISATNVLGTDSAVYFINKSSLVPNTLTLGESASRPIDSNTYPATQIYWLSPNSFFVLQNNVWKYVSNSQLHDLNINYQGMEGPSSNSTVAFSLKGEYAYIDASNNIRYASAPNAVPVKIGQADYNVYRLSITPNGAIVAYPSFNNTVQNYKTLNIQNGQTAELAITTDGIHDIAWSPSSSRAAYVTDRGLYVFSGSSSRSNRALTVKPEDQSINWIDDDSFVFAYDNTLWRHTISTGTTNGLANYSGFLDRALPIKLTSDFAYFAASKDAQGVNGGIYRIALSATSGQQSSPIKSSTITTSYSGFNTLTPFGVTSNQLTNTQYAVTKYVASLKTVPAAVKIGSPRTLPKTDSSPSLLAFTIDVDGTSHSAKLAYEGLDSIRLYVYDSKNNVIFDSNTIE